jgi:uncharacterized membrane protein YeaQ/YmgE (transglycosylase-associated protein family)
MDAVQTDQRSAVYLFLLTLILVPITIVSLLVSTALPLTLVAIAPGVIGGLMSLSVLTMPRTRTSEGLLVTVTAGVLGWLIGIILYSLIFSQITGIVSLIVVTAIQPAIFIIAITALIQISGRRRKAEEGAVPALVQQAQVAAAEPKAVPPPESGKIGTTIEKATGAPVGGFQPTPKEALSKAETGTEGKKRISELVGTGQPILVLSPQERTIVELMAELEGP